MMSDCPNRLPRPNIAVWRSLRSKAPNGHVSAFPGPPYVIRCFAYRGFVAYSEDSLYELLYMLLEGMQFDPTEMVNDRWHRRPIETHRYDLCFSFYALDDSRVELLSYPLRAHAVLRHNNDKSIAAF